MNLTHQLCDAVEEHDLKKMAALLADGADPNGFRPGEPHSPPLKLAVQGLYFGRPVDAVRLLLQAGASVDGGSEGSVTALWHAVEASNEDAVRLLLAAGAKVTFCEDVFESPLILAVMRQHLAIVEALLCAGATSFIDQYGGPASLTPLGSATHRLDIPMMELLLAHGANRQTRDLDGYTALEILERQRDEADPELFQRAFALLSE